MSTVRADHVEEVARAGGDKTPLGFSGDHF